MINSPQHEVIKFLNIVLDLVLKYYSRYRVKDFFAFVDEIKYFKAKIAFYRILILKVCSPVFLWMIFFKYVLNNYIFCKNRA